MPRDVPRLPDPTQSMYPPHLRTGGGGWKIYDLAAFSCSVRKSWSRDDLPMLPSDTMVEPGCLRRPARGGGVTNLVQEHCFAPLRSRWSSFSACVSSQDRTLHPANTERCVCVPTTRPSAQLPKCLMRISSDVVERCSEQADAWALEVS